MVGLGAVAARSHGLEGIEDGKESEDSPNEEGKRNSGLRGCTPGAAAAARDANEDSEGNGAGKPKNGGDDEQAEGDKLVEEAGQVQRCQTDISKDQQRPDRVEDDEVNDIRGARPPSAPAVVSVVPASNIGTQTKLDYGEDSGHNVGDRDEGDHDVCGIVAIV